MSEVLVCISCWYSAKGLRIIEDGLTTSPGCAQYVLGKNISLIKNELNNVGHKTPKCMPSFLSCLFPRALFYIPARKCSVINVWAQAPRTCRLVKTRHQRGTRLHQGHAASSTIAKATAARGDLLSCNPSSHATESTPAGSASSGRTRLPACLQSRCGRQEGTSERVPVA